MSPLKYYPHIDLLRVFYVTIVLMHHWMAVDPFAFLPFGSTIAFVLSGFLLITPLLMVKFEGDKYWHSTMNFLARRWLRTLPIYYLVLFFFLILNRHNFRDFTFYYLTFTQNYLFVFNRWTFFEFGHTWSLAVQEQFYVLIPILIYFMPTKYLYHLFIAMSIVGLGFRLGYYYSGVPFIFNHYTTECCIDCFGIGGLIALYQIKAPEQLKSLLSNRYLLFTIIGLYLLSTLGYARPITSSIFKMELYNNLFRITERTFVSILSIWFIAWGIHFPNKNIIKISSTKIVRYLSKISYGIYIYHFLIASIMLKLLRMIGYNTDLFNFSWWMICLKFLVTFIIASISYEMIERPILSLKDKYFPTS